MPDGTKDSPLFFGNIGNPAYYIVWGGILKGILYWESEGVGELDGPGGEPIITSPGWFLVPADDPDNHFAIGGTDLEPGMSDHDLAAVTDEAIAGATQMLAARLGLDK